MFEITKNLKKHISVLWITKRNYFRRRAPLDLELKYEYESGRVLRRINNIVIKSRVKVLYYHIYEYCTCRLTRRYLRTYVLYATQEDTRHNTVCIVFYIQDSIFMLQSAADRIFNNKKKISHLLLELFSLSYFFSVSYTTSFDFLKKKLVREYVT